MSEKPILFSGPMVRAILEGRKTMTRRVIKPQPSEFTKAGNGYGNLWPVRRCADGTWTGAVCPYVVGMRLWVREAHYRWTGCGNAPLSFNRDICYSDHPEVRFLNDAAALVTVPSIFMPRWASRLTLEMTAVRVERLREITEADAKAEGVKAESVSTVPGVMGYVAPFAELWDSINGKRAPWESNPYVWVVSFKRVSNE